MKKPKQLNSRTPQWFKDWHSNEFYHLEERVANNSKLLWLIFAAVVATILVKFIGG